MNDSMTHSKFLNKSIRELKMIYTIGTVNVQTTFTLVLL